VAGDKDLSRSPSAWPRRLPLVLLTALGFVIALYLTLFQIGVVTTVWDPFFDTGSERVLTSQLSHALPIPDASLGVVAYAIDFVLELVGGEMRWRTMPLLVVGFGVLLVLFALASIGLVLIQIFVVRALCTLCLCSAAVSVALPVLARDEVLAAWRELSRRRSVNSKEVA
jgi:uncharacterized membrane protein